MTLSIPSVHVGILTFVWSDDRGRNIVGFQLPT